MSRSPAAFAVEAADEEEFLCGPELRRLSGSESGRRRRLVRLHPFVLTRHRQRSEVRDLTDGRELSQTAEEQRTSS